GFASGFFAGIKGDRDVPEFRRAIDRFEGGKKVGKRRAEQRKNAAPLVPLKRELDDAAFLRSRLTFAATR
ncbi:MAG: hypothetical protein IJE77_01160, partial [Thermoguttaceae bacterium]|nr:hypothetical protein [Thermoguttaceae bacterium]